MPASTGYKSRIPRFRFKIGGIEEIFYNIDATKAKSTHEYEAKVLYENRNEDYPGNIAYCPEIGLISINPISIPEQTRISNAVTNNLAESVTFEARYAESLNAIKMKHPSDVSFQDKYYTTYWKINNKLRSFYIDNTGVCVYQNSTNDIITNYYDNITDVCKIKNDKVIKTGNKYNCLELDKSKNLSYTANKGIYLDFTVGNSNIIPETLECARLENKNYYSTKLIGQFVNITEKHICIEIGSNTTYRKFLLLQENQPPTFITEYTNTNIFVVTPGKGSIKFPIGKTFNVKITPYVNSLLVESDIFEKFVVYVDKQPNFSDKSIYDCMGEGNRVSLIGFGEFSFAFGQTKYYATSSLNKQSKPSALLMCISKLRNQEYDVGKPIIANALVYGNKSYCAWGMNLIAPLLVNNDGSPVNAQTTNKFAWNLGLYTTNPFLTPYLYKVIAGQDITMQAPVPIQDMATTWQNLLVTDLSISTSAEGLTKLIRTGSITFSNKQTYIDGTTINLSAMDWKTVNQRAIKIQFAYSYVDDTSEFVALTETDWQDLFTGFISDPSLKKSKYGDSTITFKLADRWQQVDERKVTWSRIYDGVKQLTTILDCLRESGIYCPKTYEEYAANPSVYDVILTSDPMVTGLVLPLAPNAWVEPTYKPKIKTSVKAFLDTVCEISNIVTYFNTAGKFVVKHLREIVGSYSAAQYTVFADYIIDSALCPNNTGDLVPPWNNVQNPTFDKDVRTGVFNTVFVMGPNEKPGSIAIDWEVVNDQNSIHNSAASNYIGYVKVLFKAMLAYGSKQIRQYMARCYLAESSYPQEVYSWTSFGNVLPLFSYVNFRENHIKTGVNESAVYFLIKNDFSFNSATLECKSEMQAKRLKGLFQLFGIIE